MYDCKLQLILLATFIIIYYLHQQLLWSDSFVGEARCDFSNKKLSYCWETVRRESMPRIAEMDVEMTT